MDVKTLKTETLKTLVPGVCAIRFLFYFFVQLSFSMKLDSQGKLGIMNNEIFVQTPKFITEALVI